MTVSIIDLIFSPSEHLKNTSPSARFRNLALNDRAKEILIEFGKLKKEFENFSNSTEDLRKKAEAMIRAIDNHETRERQMSRSISRIDSLD